MSTSASTESLRRKYRLSDAAVIGFALTLAVLAIGGVLGVVNVRRLAANERMVAHTHEVLGELESLLSTLKDAETGQRGYLLAEDVKYLQPYDNALRRLEATAGRLKELTCDNADQQARLAALGPKMALKLDELKRTVALMKAGDRPAAMKIVRSDMGQTLMDDLRDAVAAMRQEEEALLGRRAAESEARFRTTVLSVLLPAVIGVVLLGFVFYLSQRNLAVQQQAARLLAEQRERLRTTLASIGDGVISTDADGGIRTMNAVAEALTGWKLEEASGQSLDAVFRIVNEETRRPVENPATRAMKEGIIVGLANHTVLIARGGAERPIDDSAAPIRDGRGRVIGCVLVFRDTTERRQAERLLRDSEAQFRQLADAMPQIVWTARPDGHLDYYNERWYEYTGFPRGEYGEASWVSILHADDVQRCKDTYYGCIRSGKAYQIEYRFKDRTTGGYRWFLGRAHPVRDGQGRIVRWFGTCTDIDDTKKAEEALQEADRRKDEFLATLAHELRNPLAPLRNALELLRRAEDNRTLIEQARGMMDRQVGQMVRLVDDLLDVSRIARGKLQLRMERVELADVLHTAVETARPLVEASAHELTVTMPPQPVPVRADPNRLAQVFANLLNNAAKFTEKAGHIWLTAERHNGQAVVSVRDTGIGIAADYLPHIFEMFAQVASAFEQSQGGLGIGLALVKGLVELHGGTIEARSDGPGKGSEFTIHLPMVDVPPAPQEPSSDGREASDSRTGRILVVDDLRDAADSLAMMLQTMGHETRTAYDGLEAVRATALFQPDVVLLDIALPKLSGYEAARRIRMEPWGANVALVAVTGLGQEEDKRRASEAGFDHYLTKPVEAATLEKVLALTLSQRNRPGGAFPVSG
jgi:PAS domain S-box-containing protein